MKPFLRRNMKKMPKKLSWIVVFLVLGLVLTLFLHGCLGPLESTNKKERLFVVQQGTGATQIAQDLVEKGFIKNAQVFVLYAQLSGNLSKLQTGYYFLNPAMKVQEIVDKLVKGQVATTNFTIPEGYNLQQIAQVLVRKEIMTAKEFWAVVKEGDFAYTFLKDLPPSEKRLEGYLFPETYTIPLGMSAEEVLGLMLQQFAKVYQALPAPTRELTTHEIVTLASIVEGECVLDQERPLVASVFFNRLQRGQKLEADATVQYALESRTQRVLIEDTEIDSAYNTYRVTGLPPGPIGCPGEASLRAVIEPLQSDYYYFVAKKDNSGEHVFAKTFEEHKRNKQKLGY